MKDFTEQIFDWLSRYHFTESSGKLTATFLVGLMILTLAFTLLFIVRKTLTTVAHKLTMNTQTEWDDIFYKHKTFSAIAHLIPASIIYFFADFASAYYPKIEVYFTKVGELYFLYAIIFISNAVLSSLNEIYNKSFAASKQRPVAGFIQLLKIFMYFAGLLAFVAIVFDKELIKLFTGLGAAAAILMLVFKDSILGFVASIQISMNDMVKVGDWIAMSSRGADGDVIEINLTTVKVQNWDRTISMIPTYSLITESFVNWRGMEQSGGRRIKRSVFIDMHSVRFCDQAMLEKFKKFVLIKDYIKRKQDEIEAFNQTLNVSPEEHYNGRRQTNLGVFRKYLEAYLRNHPKINQDMTFLIRHLQPTEKGIPIEVYVFCSDIRWAFYESVQADIFDHILAIVTEFGLRVFQSPSDSAIEKLAESKAFNATSLNNV